MEIRVTVKRGAEKATVRATITSELPTGLDSADLGALAQKAAKAAVDSMSAMTAVRSSRPLSAPKE